MAAGDILLDNLGNILLDAAGNIMLDNGSEDPCECCGCAECQAFEWLEANCPATIYARAHSATWSDWVELTYEVSLGTWIGVVDGYNILIYCDVDESGNLRWIAQIFGGDTPFPGQTFGSVGFRKCCPYFGSYPVIGGAGHYDEVQTASEAPPP